MRRFRDISIRYKIIVVTLLASFLALGLTMVSLLSYEAVTFRAAALRNLEAEADVVAVATDYTILFDDPKHASLALNSLKANRQISAACIYAADNTIFASYRRPEYAGYQFPGPGPDGYRFSDNSVLLFRSVWSEKDKIGQLVLRYDFGSSRAGMAHYAEIFGSIAAVLLVAAFLIAALLQRLISDPILNLSKTARRVKEKNDFTQRAPIQSGDECGELAATFNEMLATIESRDQALRASKNQLAEHASELERRVDERTASLRENLTFLEGFCYSIAHDLRAPLRAMSGFSNALSQDYSAVLDEQGQEYAQRIIASATRMDKLIADLLVFGKLSQIDLTFASLDLNVEVEKVRALLDNEIKAKGGQIQFEPTRLSIWANPTVFEQVLANLIVNALKFAKSGVSPRIQIRAEAMNHHVRISIQDNGIGIAETHYERIFRVFERLHTEKEYSGTGIGLALVKKGVERMKGQVGVESTLDEGSVFWIELPEKNC